MSHDRVLAAIIESGGYLAATFYVSTGEAWQRDNRGSRRRRTNCKGRGHNTRSCTEPAS